MFKWIFLILLSGCSSMSENNVIESEGKLRNGSYSNSEWDEDLSFHRVSWYNRARLEFDLYLTNLKTSEKFLSWLSPGEKEKVGACQSAIVTISTNNFSRTFQDSDIRSALKSQGFSKISAPDFLRKMKTHPDFKNNRLHMYRTALYCSEVESSMINMSFANYKDVSITLK